MFDLDQIKKILVISLSNIGDVVLTFPVIDILKENFPRARLDVVVGPKAQGLLRGNPHIERVWVFDKRQTGRASWYWLMTLRRERFDLVVDLRNSAVPFFIGPRQRTSFFLKRDPAIHMRQQHLNRLRSVYPFAREAAQRQALYVPLDDARAVSVILQNAALRPGHYFVIAPGAADESKRWTPVGFAQVAEYLWERYAIPVVFVGDHQDSQVVALIIKELKATAVDLSGQLNLVQLAQLLQGARLVISNDSAPMHLASYADVPVVALFGPTDPVRYGPWSSRNYVARKPGVCQKCASPKRPLRHECMQAISVAEVRKGITALLG